ncbi:MAG: sel1 repeat family protein [Pseudorhodoplanes sp.]|nr:sel1 repeat family protein [Pseudorhodoplanes sp.]
MLTSRVARISCIGALFALAPAFAFDGTKTPANAPAPPVTTREAMASWAQSLKAGEKDKALSSLQYAAEQGHTLAQWKLARMYAAGDGVPRNDLNAFRYFSRIADAHADDSPDLPQARFVANAFVQLGNYYLKGIPNSQVNVDFDRAREMYSYAASYFGDADAQYSLARLYLDGVGVERDARQAVRWLILSANKGQPRAQAVLGNVLFKGGDAVPRQAARGLMWLMLARDNAPSGDKWIADMHEAAFKQASDDERQLALVYLERWLKGRRD